MKWMAVALLVANLSLPGLVDYFAPPGVAAFNDGQGRLPRVSELRVGKMKAKTLSGTSHDAL